MKGSLTPPYFENLELHQGGMVVDPKKITGLLGDDEIDNYLDDQQFPFAGRFQPRLCKSFGGMIFGALWGWPIFS